MKLLLLIAITIISVGCGVEKETLINSATPTESDGKPITDRIPFNELDQRGSEEDFAEYRGTFYLKGTNNLYTGTAYNYIKSTGALAYEYEIKDGKLHGAYTSYDYDTGEIDGKYQYENGLPVDGVKIYPITGNKHSETTYKDGKVISEYFFNEKGEKFNSLEDLAIDLGLDPKFFERLDEKINPDEEQDRKTRD